MKQKLIKLLTVFVVFLFLAPSSISIVTADTNLDGTYDINWNIQLTGDGNTPSSITQMFGTNIMTLNTHRTTHHEVDYSGKGAFRVTGSTVSTLEVSNVHAAESAQDIFTETSSYTQSCLDTLGLGRIQKYNSSTNNPDLYSAPSIATNLFRFQPALQNDGTYILNNVIFDQRLAPVHVIHYLETKNCEGTSTFPSFGNSDTNPQRNLMSALSNLTGVPLITSLKSTDATGTTFIQNDQLVNKAFESPHVLYKGHIQITINRRGGKPIAAFTSSPAKTDAHVNLDASGSNAPNNGTITAYQWDFGDGTTLTTSAPVITHKFPSHDKEYNVTLTITDSAGNTSNPFILQVHSPKIQPTAAFNFIIHSGGKVEFNAGSSTTYAPDMPLVEYQWDYDDESPLKKFNISTTDHQYNYFNQFKPFKKYKASLVVVDSEGNKSDPVTHEIDVCSPDRNPLFGFEYGGLIRCVEIAFPSLTPREILAVMRKYYYGGEEWSKRIDPKWEQIIPCGMDVPNPKLAISTKLDDALSNGSSIAEGDISHIFVGLEAMECPSDSVRFTPEELIPLVEDLKIRGIWKVNMPNYFIASWGGDVASAVGKKVADDFPASVSKFDWPHYIGPFGIRASFDDLNGDIDGLVLNYTMSSRPCIANPAPAIWIVPLSQSIQDYYPDPNKLGEVSFAYKNRIQCFNDILGIRTETKKVNVAQVTAKLGNMIYDLSLPYFIIATGKVRVATGEYHKMVSDYSKTGTEIFANWLNEQ